jgi:hypothetical protein
MERNPGLTTNRIFNSDAPFVQTVTDLTSGVPQTAEAPPDRFPLGPISSDRDDLQYLLIGSAGEDGVAGVTLLAIDAIGDDIELDGDLPFGEAPVIFNIGPPGSEAADLEFIIFPDRGQVADGFVREIGDQVNDVGTLFAGQSVVRLLQAGFETEVDSFGLFFDDIDRLADNFLAIEAQPAVITRRVRDQVQDNFRLTAEGAIIDSEGNSIDPLSFISDQLNLSEFASRITDRVGFLRVVFGGGDTVDGTPITPDEIRPFVDLADLADPEAELESILNEGSIPALGGLNAPVSGAADDDRGERFFFAAGDVDGTIDPDGPGPLPPQRDLTFTVDRFFISPGLDGFEDKNGAAGATVATSIRAFLRGETAFAVFDDPSTPQDESEPGIALNDTGVLIVNRQPEPPDVTTPTEGDLDPEAHTALLHADFGVEGTREDQRSTISVTIGDVSYGDPNPQTEGDDLSEFGGDDGNEVLVSAHTFGSSRDNTARVTQDDPAPASTFISSGLFNTAAGGGNPDLNTGVDGDGNGQPDPRPGRVGYLVFENFDPDGFAPDQERTGVTGGSSAAPVQPTTGGVEDPVDPIDPLDAGLRKEEQRYAILRLGTAVGSLDQNPAAVALPDPNVVNTRTSRALEGFAAGIGEFQDAVDIGVTPVDAGLLPDGRDPLALTEDELALVIDPLATDPLLPNLLITTSAATNRVEATMRIVGLDVARDPAEPVTLGNLDGADGAGPSAFVDDDTFAAAAPVGNPAGEYALVTALPLTDQPGERALPILGTGTVRRLSGMGDVPALRHTQWGFFLGERLAPPGDGRTVREHVHLGTWAAGEQITDDLLGGWSGSATYDGVAAGNVFTGGALSTVVGTYRNQWDFGERRGSVEMSFDATDYTGSTRLQDGSARFVGRLEAPGRRGRLDGAFVGGVSDFSDRSGRGPNGLAGQFSIRETGDADVYRASGVVAADRKGK